MLIPLKTVDFPIRMSKAVSLTFWNKSEQAFPKIAHPFSRKEAQFFWNCFWSMERHNNSKKAIVYVEILGIPEKSELLLIVTAKLLQKHGLSL